MPEPTQTTIEDDIKARLMEDYARGTENMKVLFRFSMWNAAQGAGESVERAVVRLRAEEGTQKTAQLFGCSVDELLKGLGTEESFHVFPGFNAEESREAMLKAFGEAHDDRTGGSADRVEVARKSDQPMLAPKMGDQQSQISGDARAVSQVKNERQKAMQLRPRTKKDGKKDIT